MEKMIHCKACGAEIASSAKCCPKCGSTKHRKRIVLAIVCFILGILIVLSNILSITGKSDKKDNSTEKNEKQIIITFADEE